MTWALPMSGIWSRPGKWPRNEADSHFPGPTKCPPYILSVENRRKPGGLGGISRVVVFFVVFELLRGLRGLLFGCGPSRVGDAVIEYLGNDATVS
jgi:hypothetical protein